MILGMIINQPGSYGNAAQISGQGFFPDTTQARVLVTAIPEPASVSLLLIGAALFVVKRKRSLIAAHIHKKSG